MSGGFKRPRTSWMRLQPYTWERRRSSQCMGRPKRATVLSAGIHDRRQLPGEWRHAQSASTLPNSVYANLRLSAGLKPTLFRQRHQQRDLCRTSQARVSSLYRIQPIKGVKRPTCQGNGRLGALLYLFPCTPPPGGDAPQPQRENLTDLFIRQDSNE